MARGVQRHWGSFLGRPPWGGTLPGLANKLCGKTRAKCMLPPPRANKLCVKTRTNCMLDPLANKL